MSDTKPSAAIDSVNARRQTLAAAIVPTVEPIQTRKIVEQSLNPEEGRGTVRLAYLDAAGKEAFRVECCWTQTTFWMESTGYTPHFARIQFGRAGLFDELLARVEAGVGLFATLENAVADYEAQAIEDMARVKQALIDAEVAAAARAAEQAAADLAKAEAEAAEAAAAAEAARIESENIRR